MTAFQLDISRAEVFSRMAALFVFIFFKFFQSLSHIKGLDAVTVFRTFARSFGPSRSGQTCQSAAHKSKECACTCIHTRIYVYALFHVRICVCVHDTSMCVNGILHIKYDEYDELYIYTCILQLQEYCV